MDFFLVFFSPTSVLFFLSRLYAKICHALLLDHKSDQKINSSKFRVFHSKKYGFSVLFSRIISFPLHFFLTFRYSSKCEPVFPFPISFVFLSLLFHIFTFLSLKNTYFCDDDYQVLICKNSCFLSKCLHLSQST